MIVVQALVDEDGLLRRCEVRGHAGSGPTGGDVVCAAVSVLTRTAAAILSGREGIVTRADAPERGVFILETEVSGGPGRDFLAAAGDFLLAGLDSVAREYPKNCTMTVTRQRRK
jgi:uncharacterized protein YsxB (DUF464 family)